MVETGYTVLEYAIEDEDVDWFVEGVIGLHTFSEASAEVVSVAWDSHSREWSRVGTLHTLVTTH